VLLRTSVGDVVLRLDTADAPRTTAAVLDLVRLHAYDGVPFARIERGFVAQLATLQMRTTPLDAKQRAAIFPLPLERSSLRHHRGALSLAHPAGQPDAGDPSFAILLGDAPELDDKYTIFGTVEDEAALEAFDRVLTDDHREPVDRLEIREARLLGAGEKVAVAATPPPAGSIGLTLALALATIAIGVASFALQGRVSARVSASLALVSVLIGFVAAFALLLPYARGSRWLAFGLFAAAVAIFKLMNRFESPR
jgi:cyclophilin family peptidyl-prolyl cis-trans isomerase